jgi:hypothetical protein
MLIGPDDRQQQVIVKHLRVALQRRQELREVLHGLVVDELHEARDLVEHKRVELADHGEGLPEFRADLIGRHADLLFGREHLEMCIGPGVGKPLEVAFDHRPLKVRVFQELIDHGRVGLDVELHALRVVLARRIRDRVFERLPGVGGRLRPVERFKCLVHPRPGLQWPYGPVQLRRESAHVSQPVPALAALEILKA